MLQETKEKAERNILNVYKRYPLCFTQGKGVMLYDDQKNEYLDLGGGIAVNSLGHAHPEITEELKKQASKLSHVSNLFYTNEQISLAEKINFHVGHPGKIFFCNSGTEAIECVIKLSRKYGLSSNKKNIITTQNSFHGRTFGGMSATGQEKIKSGFTPLLENFSHITYNSVEDLEKNINENTAAFMIEGIQGEGGVIPASKEFLLKARELCTKFGALFCIDAVQCGFFRTGEFQSYTRILNDLNIEFKPDAIAQAKSLGGGFPIGAVWISDQHQGLLSYGNHGSTYGGNPLACAISKKIFEIIERDNLKLHITNNGEYFLNKLKELKLKHPNKINEIRGLGLMLGIELAESLTVPDNYKELSISSYTTLKALETSKLILIPAGTNVLRILPAYIITKSEIDLAIEKLDQLFKNL